MLKLSSIVDNLLKPILLFNGNLSNTQSAQLQLQGYSLYKDFKMILVEFTGVGGYSTKKSQKLIVPVNDSFYDIWSVYINSTEAVHLWCSLSSNGTLITSYIDDYQYSFNYTLTRVIGYLN